MTVLSNEDGVFPLSARFAVAGPCGPFVKTIDYSFGHSGIDHRFNRKCHAWDKGNIHRIAMMRHLGSFMKFDADAVSDKLIYDGAPFICGVFFDDLSDLRDKDAWAERFDRFHEAFVGDIDHELLFGTDLADSYHSAAIAIISLVEA